MDNSVAPVGTGNGYRTVVVGTDGSASSLRAVDRAGAVAARHSAKLIVANAHFINDEKGSWGRPPSHGRDTDRHAVDILKSEAYQVHGDAPCYEILHEARERAKAAGAKDIEERPIIGAPVGALVDLAREVNADLLVIGDAGLHTIAGRLLGSVPGGVSHRATTDVLIVHTSHNGTGHR